MKKFSSRKLCIVLALLVGGGFGVTYLTFHLTHNSFPNPGLRNRNYTPAKLVSCAHVEVFNEQSIIDDIAFPNSKENIYVEVASNAEVTFIVKGYANDICRESSVMTRKDTTHLCHSFNFDYFDINHIVITMSAKCYIEEVNVYYLM